MFTLKKSVIFSLGGASKIRITEAELNLLRQNGVQIEINEFLTIYKEVVMRGTKYTSLLSKEISTMDYFIKLNGNNEVGAVKFYTIIGKVVYAFINTFQITESRAQFYEIKPIENQQQLVRMSDILEKVLYLKFGLRQFIVSIPNRYEKT